MTHPNEPLVGVVPSSSVGAASGLQQPDHLIARRFGRPIAFSGRESQSRKLHYVLASSLIVMTLLALLGRVIAPYDPVQPTGAPDLPLGSAHHLLGTDSIGRDLLSRMLWGLQVSWLSALLLVICGLVIGGIVGLIAGASGGIVDYLLMRITDLFLAHPGPLITITIVAALGYGLEHSLIAVTVFWWPFYARMVRGEAKSLAARPHFEAARLAGASRLRLLSRHLLPGIVPTVIVAASLDIANGVLVLAGLSFLGLGEPAPHPELGADAAHNLSELLVHPWVAVLPGLAVLLLSLVGNVGGNSVRHIFATDGSHR